MSSPESPFLAVPEDQWLCSNDLAFAIFDGFPISPGHVLVTTRRIVATWFDASAEEQAAMMKLVNHVRQLLDSQLTPIPDGYNVGFNSGGAAGQTVPHVHIYVIPRYHGDVEDPTGGIRHVIPSKANYLTKMPPAPVPGGSLALSTGHPNAPLWQKIAARVASAREVDLLASFAQPSGLDLIQAPVFSALRDGAKIRILVGDYLYITSAAALRQLVGWLSLATEDPELGGLEVRLVEMSKLPGSPDSFHPKAWRILDASGGLLVVGSSNLSKAALETGIEWNLIGRTSGDEPIDSVIATAFGQLWQAATPLDDPVVSDYERKAREAHRKFIPPESVEIPQELFPPRPWQQLALESLENIRVDAYRRALVAVATGLGKTWLAAFDVLASGCSLDRCPRVLVVAHRAEILAQAETTVRTAMLSEWENLRVSWYLGGHGDLTGDLVIASIQKLSRPNGLDALDQHRFDYAIIDEVHHAQAPSYRRVLARLNSAFTLGLTATPERTDGLDVAALFDDVLAWQATIGELPGRPMGPTHITLPDGSDWVFKFVKVACNVAAPAGEDHNQLGRLLKEWFGDDAGAPGTGYRVVFSQTEQGWGGAPEATAGARPALTVQQSSSGLDRSELPGFVAEAPTGSDRPLYVPVYSLEAAAGFWGPDLVPEEIGWAQPREVSLNPGMFIARVRGRSMEPRIHDGSWALFRPCPAGSREGRIVLVQFSSRGVAEDGGRFTVKKYHSVKSTSPDGWKHEKIELRPLNPEFEPIIVEPQDASEMVIVGELVATLT